MSGMVFRWDDGELARIESAGARALALVGMDAVAAMKEDAPVGVDRPSTGHKGGTYQRSLRTAEPGHLGFHGGDYEEASVRDLAAGDVAEVLGQIARIGNGDLLLLVGSWVYYAWYVEHGVLSVPAYPAQPTVGPAADAVATQARWEGYFLESLAGREVALPQAAD